MKTSIKFTVTKAELVENLDNHNNDAICKATMEDVKKIFVNDLNGNQNLRTMKSTTELINDCLEQAGVIDLNFNDDAKLGSMVKNYFVILCPEIFEQVMTNSTVEDFSVEIVDQFGNVLDTVPGSQCDW